MQNYGVGVATCGCVPRIYQCMSEGVMMGIRGEVGHRDASPLQKITGENGEHDPQKYYSHHV